MQGCVALLQFIPITLKALKPKETDFEPQTLGEHIRKQRLELGLTQKQAADRLRVTSFTVLNWEKGHTEPPIETVPAILRFLGYDPFPQPQNLPKRLLAKRRVMGWSIRQAARQLGVDPGTGGDDPLPQTPGFGGPARRLARRRGRPGNGSALESVAQRRGILETQLLTIRCTKSDFASTR